MFFYLCEYFKTGLESKTLQYLQVLNHSSKSNLSLDNLKRQWLYLADKFPNIETLREVK